MLKGCQGSSQDARILSKAFSPAGLCCSLGLFGEVLQGEAIRPKPSLSEVSCNGPARAWPRKWKIGALCGSRGVDKQVEVPASHCLSPPLSLLSSNRPAWRVAVTTTCSIQSDKLVGCLFRFQNAWKRQFCQKNLSQR